MDSEKNNHLTILQIEDNPADSVLVAEYVQDNGFCNIQIETEGTLASAAKRLWGKFYDLVLLDLNLPDSMGVETFNKLHQMAPKIPIIVLTGTEDPKLGVVCIQNGAQDYLSKQWLNRSLARTIWNTVIRCRMEKELNDTRSNLNILVEQNPDGVIVMDGNYEVQYMSPAAQKLFGDKLSLGQLIQIPVDTSSQGEICLTRDDGRERTLEVRVKKIVWNGKECILLALHDVSRRKRTETFLNARMDLLEEVESLNMDEFLEKAISKVCQLTDSEHGYLLILDEDQENIKNVSCFNKSLKIACPNELELMPMNIKSRPIWVRCAKSRQLESSETHNETDQRELVVPVFRSDAIKIIIGQVNKPKPYNIDDRELLAYMADIIWEMAKHKQMEETKELLAAAIDQAEETIVITDLDGTITYVNPIFEKTTGYSRKEAIGQNPRILQSGEHEPNLYKDMWHSILSGKTWRGRLINKRKDGQLYTESASISPVKSPSGEILHFVAVKTDISENLKLKEEKEQIEHQMRQSQKLESIGKLAGGVAHDFNNMLCVIIGYGNDLLRHLHESDPLRESALEIVKAGERSSALTRQLLAISRKQTLQPKIINLNTIIEGINKMLQRLIGEHIKLKTEFTHDLWEICADPGQVEQVIMNLVVNARDAMPDGGTITISTANSTIDNNFVENHYGARLGEFVVLSLSDTGIGMSKNILTQIFEPFFTTKEKGKGTGLGLSTVYGIIKQSEGNIWVSSEEGLGTQFEIFLPRTTAEKLEETNLPLCDSDTLKGKNILVVEDEISLRKLVGKELTNRGAIVYEAANGGEALLLVEERGLRPDIVLTDVVMPILNGKVLVDRLAKSVNNLKVVFMSGYTDGDLLNFSLLNSGVPFIHKPFQFSDLIKKIQLALKSSI